MSKSKPKPTMTDVLKAAIEQCGVTRYRIAKDTGIDEAALMRFVRGESSRLVATRAKLPITPTIRTRSADRPVMFFHFAYSGRSRRFDRNG